LPLTCCKLLTFLGRGRYVEDYAVDLQKSISSDRRAELFSVLTLRRMQHLQVYYKQLRHKIQDNPLC
jgi:hypothetical protein